ncbi:hypothetical protein BRD08_04590 [Halobacteriales archaeon SW_10_66_29]|nr:MAG: hypothetical protein BRD08_04590 [Halobacteriales archaeon SW_10_66_29]
MRPRGRGRRRDRGAGGRQRCDRRPAAAGGPRRDAVGQSPPRRRRGRRRNRRRIRLPGARRSGRRRLGGGEGPGGAGRAVRGRRRPPGRADPPGRRPRSRTATRRRWRPPGRENPGRRRGEHGAEHPRGGGRGRHHRHRQRRGVPRRRRGGRPLVDGRPRGRVAARGRGAAPAGNGVAVRAAGWLAAGEGGGYYRHYSYPVGVGSADRIELLQDVTTTVGNHDHLALFEELVENAQDGLFVLNADWQVEYLNRTYAQLLGFDREELLGTHVAQQLSPGEMQRAQAATERLIDGETESAVIDITLQRGDGTDVEASVHFWPRYTDDGRYAGLMGAVHDITDRKARERELERYETIVQAVGDPVCTIDAEGRFVYVNDAFEERTGYELSTLRGEPISLVIGADAAATGEALITELLADPDSTTATFELQLPDRDGATTPTECQIALLPQEDGQYQGAVVVMRDISRLKRREQRLSKFAGVVSHDLRNPLDVALGRAEVLPDVADLDPETEHHVGEIYESLKRMEQLIEDVLAIARHGEMAVDLAPVSLEEVAAEAWASVETGDAELRIASTATVRAHRSRLLRLFENLFRNAIEHGGPDVLVEVGTIDDGSDAGFYVADDGSGIPGDQRDVIFDDGFSTTADGTGLGLSIVSEIVRAHDWSIDIADGIDGGARFEFTGVAAADQDSE